MIIWQTEYVQSAGSLKSFRNDPIVEKRKTWSRERIERQKQIQRDHYARLQLRNDHGICAYSVKCNHPFIGSQRFCLWHWCKGLTLADMRAKSKFTPDELVSLWTNQGGNCAISGVPLIPGDTAALDHIIPIAKGGLPSIENVQFVHVGLNRFKWDMLEEDFGVVVRHLLPGLIKYASKPQ